MPGIVGLVRPGEADVSHIVAEAARTLLHLDSLTMRSGSSQGVGLAQVWRGEARTERDWFEAPDVAVRIAGHVLQEEPSQRRLNAADVAEAYRSTGRVPAADYDGAFTIVVVDRARRRLHLVNDRVGALPVYFAQRDEAFAFGPEIKSVLAAVRGPARLDRDGVVAFLLFGYCFGEHTIFDGMRCLPPAQVLTVELDSCAWRSERYWNLRFRSNPGWRAGKSVEQALYDTLCDAHRLILCDQPAAYEVLLSGGLDSRGLLAFAREIGHPPARAFTWGLSHTVPKSDAFVARCVAEHFAVPHRFHSYDSAEFVRNARDWIYVSELANDNIGWFAEGQPTLASVYRSEAAFALSGDVVWDSGGYVYSDGEMREGLLPPAPLSAVLRRDARDEGERIYHASIDTVLASCEDSDPTNRKEYLYLNARVARYILSLGYYREHAIEIRRPFLSRASIELFASMPQNQRVWKFAYVDMLENRFPRLMEIPEKSLGSLPEWSRDVRAPGPLRDLWRHYLSRERVERGVLGSLLDGERFATRVDAFFAGRNGPPPAGSLSTRVKTGFPLKRHVLPVVRRYRATDRMSRIVRVGGPNFDARTDFDLLRTVLLVTMLEDSLDRFSPQPALTAQVDRSEA